MTDHREIAREVARTAPRRRAGLRYAVLGLGVAAVLVGGRSERGAAAVDRLHVFLEFYVGVFALLALTAAVVAGLAASWQLTPIRLRVLAQSAHRATAVMSVSFLAAHVLLKVLERHATLLDVVVPFGDGSRNALWIGLGTIASNMMIIVFVAGAARGRFIGRARGWTWRALHITAYLCWPVAIVHGLVAGRTPKDWVTLSYVVCAGLVAVVGMARLVSSVRRFRRAARWRDAPGGRRPAAPPPEPSPAADVPDASFWAELKAEAAQWTGNAR